MIDKITATTLLQFGYSPVSVIPPNAKLSPSSNIPPEALGKIPGVKGTDGKWIGYSWNKYMPTARDLAAWDASGANIGILSSSTPALDIDVDDVELAKQIEQKLLEVCGDAPIRVGKSPRSLLIYRSEQPLKKQRLEFSYNGGNHAVELLAEGQQFVVRGLHPSGCEYSVDKIIPHDNLTILKTETMQSAMFSIGLLIKSAGGTIIKSAEQNPKAASVSEAPATVRKVDLSDKEIREKVESLNPDMLYPDWIKVGQGLHAQYAGGETGLIYWKMWSQRGIKYKVGECERKWETFKPMPDGITFASVMKMTRDNTQPYSDVREEEIPEINSQKTSYNDAAQSTSTTDKPGFVLKRPKNAADLMKMTFNPTQWLVEGILPEGCHLLAAHPKIGKSWLALQLCAAVTNGVETLGRKVTKGNALYLALEDNQARLQRRLSTLAEQRGWDVNLLQYENEWPKDNEGGAESIEQWVKESPNAKLIVIDTLEKYRTVRNNRNNQYGEDYNALGRLKQLSDKYRVTILLVHHLKKGVSKAADILESISGSMGLSAAVDGILHLTRERTSPEGSLQITGRDIADETKLPLSFNDCIWTYETEPKKLLVQGSKLSVIGAVETYGREVSASEISAMVDMNPSTLRGLLTGMVKDGLLSRSSRGKYALPKNGGDPHDIDPLDLPDTVPLHQQHNKQTFMGDYL